MASHSRRRQTKKGQPCWNFVPKNQTADAVSSCLLQTRRLRFKKEALHPVSDVASFSSELFEILLASPCVEVRVVPEMVEITGPSGNSCNFTPTPMQRISEMQTHLHTQHSQISAQVEDFE